MNLFSIIGSLAGVACLVFGIIVGTKVLQRQGTGLGILAILLAIFCVLPTFIWGWAKAKEFGIQRLMIWYTVAVVLLLVFGRNVVVLTSGATP